MSGYLRQITHKQTFDGDEVTVTMKPITLEDSLSLRSAPRDEKALAEALVPVLTKNLLSFSGLRAADGTDVTREEFLTSAYFSPLVMAAATELFKHATPQNPTPPAP